jgi:Phosphodiester glycosidase
MNDRQNPAVQQLFQCLTMLILLLLSGCNSVSNSHQIVASPSPQLGPETAATSVATGIRMWTNTEQKSYVIEADLHQTELRSLSGAIVPPGKVSQRKFGEFWEQNKASQGKLQVLINGTFFQTYDKPTGIAFGLKQNSQFITYGYGLNEFPTQTLTVNWSEQRIWIEPHQRSNFATMPNVVGALSPTAGKNAHKLLPRTFIGVKDQIKGHGYKTVLLFISPAATQSEAEQTLRKFGAEQVAMLDGGASTGLIVNGKIIMQPRTRLPQTIGIFTK